LAPIWTAPAATERPPDPAPMMQMSVSIRDIVTGLSGRIEVSIRDMGSQAFLAAQGLDEDGQDGKRGKAEDRQKDVRLEDDAEVRGFTAGKTSPRPAPTEV
jgi:hypothetical protein